MNPLNEQDLAAARQTVSRIKAALEEQQIRQRDRELFDAGSLIEREYRHAEAGVEQAKRRVAEVEAALKECDSELLIKAAGILGEDQKPKYTTVDAKKAAAITLRKTDEEYLAIKAELTTAKADHEDAENRFADAKADQRVLVRAHEQLLADKAYLTACIQSFGAADAPAATPAPVKPPVAA